MQPRPTSHEPAPSMFILCLLRLCKAVEAAAAGEQPCPHLDPNTYRSPQPLPPQPKLLRCPVLLTNEPFGPPSMNELRAVGQMHLTAALARLLQGMPSRRGCLRGQGPDSAEIWGPVPDNYGMTPMTARGISTIRAGDWGSRCSHMEEGAMRQATERARGPVHHLEG